jgi:hypothetical protein
LNGFGLDGGGAFGSTSCRVGDGADGVPRAPARKFHDADSGRGDSGTALLRCNWFPSASSM